MYQGHVNSQYCIFSTFLVHKDRALVATGSEDNSIYVYDVNQKQVGGAHLTHADTLLGRPSLKMPCGAVQVVYKAQGRAPGEEGSGHCDAVLCVHAHPTKPLLASCAHQQDGSAKVWSLSL